MKRLWHHSLFFDAMGTLYRYVLFIFQRQTNTAMKVKTIIFYLSILAVLATTACSNKKESKEQVDKLTIGVMSSMDYLPLAVAQKSGFFADEGVEVEIRKFYSANERDAALQSNNLDGTILDYTGGAIQLSGGIPIQFTSQCDGTFVLMTGQNSDFNTVSDLKDKKIAISRNTVIDFCTDMIFRQSTGEAIEYEAIEINKIPLRLEMLNNGKIDATMLPEPFVSIAKLDGNKGIISMDDLGVKITGIAFLQKAIEEKPEALRKMYRAYNKAVVEINSKSAEGLKEVLVKEVGFPEDVLNLLTLPHFSFAQLPQTSDMNKVEEWLKEKNLIKEDFDIVTLTAPGFIPQH